MKGCENGAVEPSTAGVKDDLLRETAGCLPASRHEEIAMIVDPADRAIVKWALDHAAPFYYANERDLPQPCLKVQCGCVTAFFSQGKLTRVQARADSALFGEMFCEFAQLFELCGRPDSLMEEDAAVIGAPSRLWRSDPPGYEPNVG
jgi:hypothetical protein